MIGTRPTTADLIAAAATTLGVALIWAGHLLNH